MFARLMLVAMSAVSAVTVTPWEKGKDGQARELRFTDSQGAHVVKFLLGAQRQTKTADGYSRNKEFFVTHSLGAQQVWKAKDFVQRCEFDLELEMLDDSIEVTDLDNDGVAEISFLYKLGCRSDVSPLEMKLLMYEGTTKYALRGESYERVGETEYAGGTFKPDFKGAPPAFLEFAKTKWERLVKGAK